MIESDNFCHHQTFESVKSDLRNMWSEGIQELENAWANCTDGDENNNDMDGVEVIDLCSVSRSGTDKISEGKESAMQESQDKSKHNETNKKATKLKTVRNESTTKKDNVESAMMCWESTESFVEKEHREEPEKMTNKPVETTEKQKHEEEHVEPTLNIGNRLKISIEEFSWEREGDGPTLGGEEPEQQQIVYITNLEDGLRKDGTTLYEEEVPNEKKPAARNRPIEVPSLNNPNHVFDTYGESDSDVIYIEDFLKGEARKNSKEHDYANMDLEKEGKQADLQDLNITRYHHEISRKKGENEKALVTKEMGLGFLEKNIFIGDSAATSHMTNRKLGVYDLVPINGSVMIGNGKSISCTHRGKMDVICKHKDGSLARETWEVKIVPELNHDLFSFTKAMKDRWQMNGRWKEGGLMIELFKTGRASMKFDRMIPSGSSWLMGIKVHRVYDEAHGAMEAGKSIRATKLHNMTGHTGEHLLKPTANYMKLKLIGRLPPCEVCAKAKIRQRNVQKKKIKKMRSKLDNRGKTCMFVGYADDHTKDVYRFLNIHTKRIILSRDVRWLNVMWKQYKKKSIYARSRVELFLDEEESSLEDDKSFGELSIKEMMEASDDDGNNTETQKKLGIDINMIGAREETLGRTRSETKSLSSPTNESMERADFTLEEWIQETCLISAVTSGPNKPKTFQEAWHSPVEEERNNWQMAIRKEIKSMIERGVWRKVDRKNIPNNRRLIGNKWVFKIKRDGTYKWHWDTAKYQEWIIQTILLQWHMMCHSE